MSKPRSLLLGCLALLAPLVGATALAQGFSVHLGSPSLASGYALPVGSLRDAANKRSMVRLGQSGLLEADPSGRGQMGLSDLSLMGDYYFKRSTGLRASGGLLFDQPRTASEQDPLADTRVGSSSSTRRTPAAQSMDSRAAQGAAPYLGLGYTGTAPDRPWGFFADVGMVMLKPRSTVQLGSTPMAPAFSDPRMYESSYDLGDWRPLIQLGVSYRF